MSTADEAQVCLLSGERKKECYNPPPKTEGILNESDNMLLFYRLDDCRRRSNTNFWLALLSLLCCAVNMGLLYLNFSLHHSQSPPNVADRTLHMLEFWTTFVYAIIDAYALITTPKALLQICHWELLLKILFFFNVVAALVPALLITLDTEYFEVPAHELEYINEFTMSLVTLILLVSLVDGRELGMKVMVILSVIVSLLTLTIYNWGPGEEAAHYLEFTFNTFVSLVTFWFCMDNRFIAEMEIGQILFGTHRDCNLCRTTRTSLRNQSSVQWQRMYRSLADGQGPTLFIVEEDTINRVV